MYLYGWIPSLAVHLKPTQHCLLIGYTPTENKKLKKEKETSRRVCVCVCVCVYLCHPELYPYHTDILCLHTKDQRIFSTSTKKYVFSLSFLERDRPLSLAFVFLLFNRDIRKGNILLSSFFSNTSASVMIKENWYSASMWGHRLGGQDWCSVEGVCPRGKEQPWLDGHPKVDSALLDFLNFPREARSLEICVWIS